MEITTKYITGDDFKVYFGIDLSMKLKDGDNPSNKVDAFLMRIENDMSIWLDYVYHQDVDLLYPTFTDNQKLQYQYALLEQAIYVFRNGDIAIDSGYDPDAGVKATRNELQNLMIAPKAIMHLHKAGLCDRYLNYNTDGRNIWVL